MFRQERNVNGKKYLYVSHSYRIGGSVRKVSFYLGKDDMADIPNFSVLNKEIIKRVATERMEYIKKSLRHSRFYDYGGQIEKIESFRVEFHVLFSLVPKAVQEKLMEEFLTRFLVSSMAMEGGTITYDAARSIDEKRIVRSDLVTEEDKKLYRQFRETYLVLRKMKLRYPAQIKKLHRSAYLGIYSFAGEYRKEAVTFGNLDNPAITTSPANILNGYKSMLDKYYKSKARAYDFERIIEFHKDYEAVHGFSDGNSRLGRLIMAHQFMQAGYPPLILKDTSSKAYRMSLVQAINERDNASLNKLFYNAYCKTFTRFWREVIHHAIDLDQRLR